MPDLPDYYIQAGIVWADIKSFDGGLDANKSDTPVSRDIYLATDTHILYVCFVNDEWTGFDASILTQGILTLYANMLGGGFRLTNIADPTAAQDAATKAYADALEPYTDAEAVAAVEAAGLTLAALKKIIYANDGVAQFGVLDGSPTVRGGRAAHPFMLIVQPKDGNTVGEICVIPKGTEDRSYYCLYNSSDLENYGYFDIGLVGELVHFIGGKVGTGTAPSGFRFWEDVAPGESLGQGLGIAGYWWKHIMAYKQIIRAGVSADDPVSGTITDVMQAGENLVLGDAVYIKDDGKLWKADADLATTMPIMALAAATIAANALGEFLLRGFMYKAAWDWTVGGIIYSSITAGGMSQTAPVGSGDQVQVVGVAKTADIIYFNPSLELVEISA